MVDIWYCGVFGDVPLNYGYKDYVFIMGKRFSREIVRYHYR